MAYQTSMMAVTPSSMMMAYSHDVNGAGSIVAAVDEELRVLTAV